MRTSRYSFYDSPAYRAAQRAITTKNVVKGIYDHLRKREQRTCANLSCSTQFFATPSDPKRFCSRSCAATVNNSKRVWKEEIRRKIARTMTGKANLQRGIIKVPRLKAICANPACQKIFFHERHRSRMYCGVACASLMLGRRPTSPRASRGKAGIRRDIDSAIYFYSRWEANMARLYTYLGIRWEFAPRSFDIGNQLYTPDFYLPDRDMYVEVKNFLGEYSRIRDEKFHAKYPHLSLQIILKEEYLELERTYAHLIEHWEYKNSPFSNEE